MKLSSSSSDLIYSFPNLKKRFPASGAGQLLACVFVVSLFSNSALAAEPGTSHFLDWVPRNELSPEEQSALPSFCAGSYRPLPFQQPEGDSTQITAESADYLADGSIHLRGNVKIISPEISLQAEEAKVSADRSRIEAINYVTLRQNGVVVHGDEGKFNLNDDQFEIVNPEYALPKDGMRGKASTIIQTAPGEVVISDGSYTSCAPGDNSWRLVGSDIELDQESGFGTAIHARLELADIPVFYWPYFRFPIDDRRHTGLLMPSLSVGSDGLDEYEQPLYLNLAPNADATLSP
ncbi:LptA/OstA family protein, partial [Oceanospirillum sp. HFRX-1_2]